MIQQEDMMDNTHDLDRRGIEVYTEMLGRVEALKLVYRDTPLRDITQDMVDISRTPVAGGRKDRPGEFSSDVLMAFIIYKESGIDECTKFLVERATRY